MVDTVAMYKLLKDCVDMPEQNYNRRLVTMSPAQAQAYGDMEEQLLALYGGAQTTAANKITAMIRLQQISSGFIVNSAIAPSDPEFQDSGLASMYLVDEEEESDYDLEPGQVVWLGDNCPKMEMMFNDIEEASLPCIIVTRFSAEAARIYDELSKTHSCCLMTGWKRIGTIDEFKEGKYEIMVANIRVISKGFNLQVAHQMFFYSNTFSLEDRLQAEGRIFRIGQASVCSYTDYVNDGTIDLKVVGALRQKRALLDYIRGTSLTAFVKDEDEVVAIENAELEPVAHLTDQQVLLNTAMADVKEFAKSFLEEV
jgi:SNF2 family DNA or RNA helicase